MTVKELIKQLQKMDQNAKIISPQDDEGNGYRWPEYVGKVYLFPHEAEEYRPEYVWSDDKDEADDLKQELEDHELEMSDLVPVVYVG